jgi:transposase
MAFGKPRDPRKELLWRRMVRRQAGSGLSIRAWCEKHALREATFYWWRAELGRRDAADGESVRAEQPAFVPVHVTDDVSVGAEARIEIVLSGGRRVLVRGRVDRQMLADVLSVMTSTTSLEEKGPAC